MMIPSLPVSALSTHDYDALGRLISRETSSGTTTRYYYNGWQVIEERDNTGQVSASYVYGSYIDEPVTMTGRDCGEVYFHADDNYNVIALTGSSGTPLERYAYDDYGLPRYYDSTGAAEISNATSPILFQGRRYDYVTGLYDFRTRSYDAYAGQFTTRDSIGVWGDTANLGNAFAFVGNNPWNRLDPYGLAMLFAFDGTGNNMYDSSLPETNVAVLFTLYKYDRHYVQGLGTGEDNVLSDAAGQAVGVGAGKRLEEAMQELRKSVAGGETVFDIIGFSRGTGLQREFANLANDEFGDRITIRFVGMFDSVASFGRAGDDYNYYYSNGKKRELRLKLPKSVQNVMHITAADEHRRNFPLTSILPSAAGRPAKSQHREVSMTGSHSDIGGGYSDFRGLGNIALKRMHDSALAVGVPFYNISPEYTPRGADIRYHNSLTGGGLGSMRDVLDGDVRYHKDRSLIEDPRVIFYHGY